MIWEMWLQIIIAALVITFFTLFKLFWSRSRPKEIIKQLPGSPILDPDFLIDDDEPCDLLACWADKYGPIFKVERLDSPPVIFVSDIIILRKIYQDRSTFQRNSGLLPIINYDKTTMDPLEYDYILKYVTNLNLTQALIKELEYFILMLKNQKGNPFNEHRLTLMVAVNTMLQALFDYRFHYDDLELHHFINMQETNFQQIEKLQFKDIFSLPLLPEDLKRQREIEENMSEFMDYYKEILKNNNQVPFLLPDFEEMKLQNGKNTHCSLMTLHHIFMVGVTTITSILRWMLLYLILNPDIQTKLQEEDNTKEPAKTKTLLNDTIKKIIHTHKTLSLGPSFINRIETSLSEYRIPANCLIYPNILNMKNCCSSSEEEQCLIFGQGACPTQLPVHQLIRQFICTLLSTFTIKTPDNLPSPSINPVGFLILNPQPFLIQAIERKGKNNKL